ncbi:1,4-alpha-glucan branching protein GlgB [Sphingobacterium corticibacter]|uniref:1,4-alpha-glucan branching enzyme GlgB n=1 Tax=Sphingobacterium corticibacter TaxID=2171749 RepID=A0A2T8HIE8_9SPHI|nr:1,4-alpha-glucan branching protein GlgB [Sphingobacterium corticibacter]PVH25170.1 1,4-alpha-glucan branching protein GlgB [Sphingobacterium corticibacter]
MGEPVVAFSLFTDYDIMLFRSGKHYKLYEKLGSRTAQVDGVHGVYFAVWAPNANYVSIIGDFNGWNSASHPLKVRWDESGIWEGFIPTLENGTAYKYHIGTSSGEQLEKADPFAIRTEVPPRTASIVDTTWYTWEDNDWMGKRQAHNALDKPISVYEMHLGSWMRDANEPDRFLNYREIAARLVPYIQEMGFTHVEFMPVMEHPYYPSWGYQITGYFACSSRYGSPQDFMHLIEALHQADIGVILDWVPSHFPGDAHGLYKFDGTHLFEHADPKKGYHPDWKSYIFNYGRNEIKSFLISNALFWLDLYHVDGLRVDAVASMLYLDYSRNYGEWETNEFGGNENLEAVAFLKEFNEAVYTHFPDVQTIAEESTSWAGVSRPTYQGGLGFGMKWMMGWMHDTLSYFKEDPINRKYAHDKMTFATVYGFHENFMLPFSHDEVVYGKKSMLYKMPGDDWQRVANLRTLYLYMFTFLGTKLLFMGGEFGQTAEWNVDQSLDWHLLEYAPHQGVKKLVASLNALYKSEPALYEKAFSPEGFEWIEMGDRDQGVFVYLRKGHDRENDLVVVLNLTPVVRSQFRIGVPQEGIWQPIFNSDEHDYYGSGISATASKSEKIHWMHRDHSIAIDLPPLAGVVYKQKQTKTKKVKRIN